jgi:hypothetical protein
VTWLTPDASPGSHLNYSIHFDRADSIAPCGLLRRQTENDDQIVDEMVAALWIQPERSVDSSKPFNPPSRAGGHEYSPPLPIQNDLTTVCGQQSRGFCGPVDSDACKAHGQRGFGRLRFVADERTMPFTPGIVIGSLLFSEPPAPFG